MTHAGKSIIEMLWEQADILYEQLMDVEEPWTVESINEVLDNGGVSGAADPAHEIADYWELRGKLGGLTYALAKMRNPYENPKTAMEAIKAELQERWEEEE